MPITRRARGLQEVLRAKEKSRGLLIAFEGPHGAGATTQRKLFRSWLESEGQQCATSKWNSSPLLKPLIKARKAVHALSPVEACLLHAAEFRHRLEEQILPALWQGISVVADHYLFTALARDAARGLPFDRVVSMYAPIFWPDIVFYFAVSPETSGQRIAAERKPSFYEAGQDVTGEADSLASYREFIQRVIKQYESLALVFEFVTVDGEQSIYEQHRAIRELFHEGRRRPWTQWNVEAIREWLASHPQANGGQ